MQRAMSTNLEARETQTFKISWLRLYAAMTSGIVLVFGPLLLLAYVLSAETRQTLIDLGLPIFFAAMLAELSFALVLAGCYPVHVGAEGIHGFTFWGVRCKMRWQEIDSAAPARLLGLPWLVVRSSGAKNALWLPLFLSNPRDLWGAIRRHAPPSCPLLRISAEPKKAH